MKIFRTKNQHSVPLGRTIIKTEVFLKISKVEIDENGVIPHGYYFIEIEETPHKLDDIVPSLLSWEQIHELEKYLPTIGGNTSLKEVIYQRAEEFALMKLQMEGHSNYNIDPNDWEEYVKPIIEKQDEEVSDVSTGSGVVAHSDTADTSANAD